MKSQLLLVIITLLMISCTHQYEAQTYKLFEIDNSQIDICTDIQEQNTETIRLINRAVQNSGNRPAYVEIQNIATEISKKSTALINSLEEIRKEIIINTGGVNGNEFYNGAEKKGYIQDEFVAKSRAENEIQIPVTNYTDTICILFENNKWAERYGPTSNSNKNIRDIFINLTPAPDEKEIISITNNKLKKLTYSEYYFGEGTTTIEALVYLSYLETQILLQEKSALNQLASLVGTSDITFSIETEEDTIEEE